MSTEPISSLLVCLALVKEDVSTVANSLFFLFGPETS